MTTMEMPPPSNHERAKRLLRALRAGEVFEFAYPFAGGALAAYALWRAGVDRPAFDGIMKDVVPAALSVAAIFAGFQGAIHAILLSMLRSRLVKVLREKKLYGRLIYFIRSGFLTLIAFVAAALAVLVLVSLKKCPDTAVQWVAPGLLGLFVWSLLASVRITLIEVKMLKSPDE